MVEVEDSEPTREQLLEKLEAPHEELQGFLEDVHSADLAEWMQDLDEKELWQTFDCLGVERRAEVLEHAEEHLRERLLEHLTPRQLSEVVQELPADEVVDLLALADDKVSEQVLRTVDLERAADLRELAQHAPDTAGGLMTTEFLTVPSGTRIGDAIKVIKTEGEEVEEGLGLFVVDEKGHPLGYVNDRSLLTNSIHDVVDESMVRPITVPVDEDQEEAANLILHYDLHELGVVDREGILVGVISSDDAHDVHEEEASEDIHKLVGTSANQQTRLPILKRVLARLPLQGVTVMGGLATAKIIHMVVSGGEPASTTELLRFVPIVIGLAGNVGIQSSTILVRAFATGEVESDRELSVLRSEVLVGLVIGLLCGGVTAMVLALTEGGAEPGAFGGAVGTAIAAAVTWAAFLGCFVPMGCRRIGIDPAIVAGPFLVAVSDTSGTALYLGVAHLLL